MKAWLWDCISILIAFSELKQLESNLRENEIKLKNYQLFKSSYAAVRPSVLNWDTNIGIGSGFGQSFQRNSILSDLDRVRCEAENAQWQYQQRPTIMATDQVTSFENSARL